MANLTNLPRELTEEVLSRIPVTSLRRSRSTCKKWNTLFKDGTFTKKHLAQAAERKAKGEILAILLMNYKLSMVSINLHNDFDPSIRTRGNLTGLNVSDKLNINQVCHCDGLVLCVIEDYTKFVVWNPYTGETGWICLEPIPAHHPGSCYGHALGYDKSTHKVLRFYFDYFQEDCLHEIYHVNSKSRRVLDGPPDWVVADDTHGLSLKGNTYWYAHNKEGNVPNCMICFDFTTERFVPCLPLPFMSYAEDTVILSSVREEQLAVLFPKHEMEIWVTTKIEPNTVSWSKFLVVDTHPRSRTLFSRTGSFIVDEEKTTVVVFNVDKNACKNHTAYFIGVNGYYREVDLGEIAIDRQFYPLAFSYDPSSVPIDQPA